MDKGPPKYNPTEVSEKRTVEDDSGKQDVEIEHKGKEQGTPSAINGTSEESRKLNMKKGSKRQNEEDKLKEIRDRTESKEGKLDDSLDRQENKSKEYSTTNIAPKKTLNKDEKSQIQDQSKPVKSSDHLKQKLLDLERELSVENIERKATGIFFPSDRYSSIGTEKEVPEVTIMPSQRKGISNHMAVLFIIAACTGSAFQSLPYHLKETTWFGVFFLLLLGLNSLYTCLCTGWCWSLMEEIWPEYLAWCRVPYQEIAYRSVGAWMK